MITTALYRDHIYRDGWSREGDDGCSGDGDEYDDGWFREEDDGFSGDGYEEDTHHITNSSSTRPFLSIFRYPSVHLPFLDVILLGTVFFI